MGEEAVEDSRIDSGIGGRAGSHLSWLFPHKSYPAHCRGAIALEHSVQIRKESADVHHARVSVVGNSSTTYRGEELTVTARQPSDNVVICDIFIVCYPMKAIVPLPRTPFQTRRPYPDSRRVAYPAPQSRRVTNPPSRSRMFRKPKRS